MLVPVAGNRSGVDTLVAFDAFVDALDYPMFVVTTVHPGTGERAGCLVGFATQCSIDPPRFLVCLSRSNHTYRVAVAARLLAVHQLPADRRDLAALFGTRTGDEVDKFARCRWRAGPGGVPLLDGCPDRFVGEVVDRLDLGDHAGVALRPVAAWADGAGGRLMFSGVRTLAAGHPA
jgi:flavin reductase (DIM6/NTAB) family NADH-FMN oxidoreductase RutF